MHNFHGRKVLEMGNTAIMYPRPCRANIHRIVDETGIDVETAYAMMLMTAALMDLHPWDDEVADMILEDCGVSPECA